MCKTCDYCINKDACGKCDKQWHDMFIPSDKVRKYFSKGYVGVRGIDGYIWSFDTTRPSLVPTHSIIIHGSHYCPYCGDPMYSIQDKETLDVVGYCCICEGAEAEIEYERKKEELGEEYERKLSELQSEYREQLSFCMGELMETKQKLEKESFEFFNHKIDHFSGYTDIQQIIH